MDAIAGDGVSPRVQPQHDADRDGDREAEHEPSLVAIHRDDYAFLVVRLPPSAPPIAYHSLKP